MLVYGIYHVNNDLCGMQEHNGDTAMLVCGNTVIIRGFGWKISPYFKQAMSNITLLKFARQMRILIPFTSVANFRI